MAGVIRIRKRLKRREVDGGLRFITFSCQGRLPLLSNPRIADVFAGALSFARAKHGFRLIAWVIMPEHVHMIVVPPESAAFGPILAGIKLRVAKQVIARWTANRARILARLDVGGGSLRFWQKGGGFDRNIRDIAELCREIRYTHRNPVERGLIRRADEWRWSSVRWWMGCRDQEVECDLPPGDETMWKQWMEFV